jgi:hypothetical protein
MTLDRYKIASKAPVPTGKIKIEVETWMGMGADLR